MKIEHARKQLLEIIHKTRAGLIEYDEAKRLADPLIEILDARAAEIAKQYGQRPRKTSFAYLLRALPNK